MTALVPAAPALAAPPAEFGGPGGTGAGEFAEPSGIAVDQSSGDAYVVDRNNNRVEKFGPAGEFLLAFGWGVADGSTGALQICTTTCFGGEEAPFGGPGAGQLSFPEGIAVDQASGDLYVIDTRNHRVQKFTSGGEFIYMLGGGVDQGPNHPGNICTAASLAEGDTCGAGAEEGTGPGEFNRLNGRAIAVGPGGGLFVGDIERVQKFNPAGVLQGQFSLPGSGFLENLAVDSAGDLYAQSSELPGVRKYDSGGTELGAPRDAGGRPGPLAIGPAGELFAADIDSEHVLGFDPAGSQISSTFEQGDVNALAYGESAAGLFAVHEEFIHFFAPATPGKPYVVKQSATEIVTQTATLNAILNPEGGAETSYRFEYGTEAGVYTESTPATPLPLNEVQSLTLVAEGGTFTLAFEGEAGAAIPFNATAAAVQSALEAIPALGAGNVTVSGPPGGPYAIQFTGALAATDVAELVPDPTNLTGEDPSATILTTSPGHTPFDDRQAAAAITGLAPRTVYHYRVVATNAAAETTFGPDQSFETLPPVSIESESASQITATSARLETELNPHGLSTHFHFEYGPSAAYGTSVPVPDADAGQGTETLPFAAAIQGLVPATTYHYRVVAENALGSVLGPDRTFATQGPSSSALLDGRAWELVSPVNKHGVALEAIAKEGGLIQAAADGGALTYFAKGPIDSEPAGNRSVANSQFISRRAAAGGWGTVDASTPHQGVAGLRGGEPSEYKFFASDLRQGLVEPFGATPLVPAATERTPYIRTEAGEYVPLLTAANTPPGSHYGGEEAAVERFQNGTTFVTASASLATVVLRSPRALTEGFAPQGEQDESLYAWRNGALELISELPDGHAAAEAGLSAVIGSTEHDPQRTVSAAGSRVIFFVSAEEGAAGGAGHLYSRNLNTHQTIQVDPGAGGHPQFQSASADGTRIFFTDQRRLTAGATAKNGKPDLYMCELSGAPGAEGCQLSDLSVDPNPGETADVIGTVLGSGEDGRFVYFVAHGRLGAGAVAGAPNLYAVDTTSAALTLIATLAEADEPDWLANQEDLGGMTARVSPNGRYLAFMSQRSLTGYDNRDTHTNQSAEEVYLYHAAASQSEGGGLSCVSCNPTGARPAGVFDKNEFPGLLVDRPRLWADHTLAASVPGWTRVDSVHALYQSRYLSDSGRLFFNAADALVPQDSNRLEDVYSYEPPGVGDCAQSSSTFVPAAAGCVSLISSGASSEESAFLDASESGNDVFFLTASRLVPRDTDSALDVYDARVGGGEPEAITPPECDGDACQPPATPPSHPTPGTALLNGPGNLLQCPKGKGKRHGKCVARKHKKAHKKHHRAKQKRAASTKRMASR